MSIEPKQTNLMRCISLIQIISLLFFLTIRLRQNEPLQIKLNSELT